ncbi:type II toxin-antitoxin system HicB family antitoxin [Desulfonema magnum]|uniref:Toxin-antitoxin system, antitoxin component, HicB-like n=1 Tax=Desulfonema magnum TaxID=45655 RepID=A0A975BVX2_9BACT|nr:type II toxin-antitoxin system HicB family antitoxin [Desulfonema magnum]QTA92731.1 Toxin-antitoxin system, antitoxin component, HicB-like [Desulfonema magnum]
MSNYIALIHKDSDSDYGVSFPDFPGCISAGETIEEAGKMAGEALTGHVKTMLEYGEKVPPPSTLEDIIVQPENADAIAFIVVTISQPELEFVPMTAPSENPPEYTPA